MDRNGRVDRWLLLSAIVSILVVVLVGTALAGSGPATKTVSITKVSKDANRALSKAGQAIQIARTTGKQQGPKGDMGPKGDAGPRGPSGVSGFEIVEAATAENSSDTKEEVVSCPAGKRVFGGGASVEGPALSSVAIDLSAPGSNNSWEAGAHEHTATGSSWELVVYAICGNAS